MSGQDNDASAGGGTKVEVENHLERRVCGPVALEENG